MMILLVKIQLWRISPRIKIKDLIFSILLSKSTRFFVVEAKMHQFVIIRGWFSANNTYFVRGMSQQVAIVNQDELLVECAAVFSSDRCPSKTPGRTS